MKKNDAKTPVIENGFSEVHLKIVNVDPISSKGITTPVDLVTFMGELIGDEAVEYFAVVYLNHHSQPMNYSIITKGGWASALVDMKVIFSTALLNHADKLMLFHNHPDAKPIPSKYDISTT